MLLASLYDVTAIFGGLSPGNREPMLVDSGETPDSVENQQHI